MIADNNTPPTSRASAFQNQYVRDLDWLFSSPPILDFDDGYLKEPLSFSWLKSLDENPEQLVDHLAAKNLKMLGPYFEALWEFYLLNYPGLSLKAKNLQVFQRGETLGEFDFIYENQNTGQFFHLEVAVKYYLGNAKKIQQIQEKRGLDLSSPKSQSLWVGPGTRDRLDKKAEKLISHQSRLSLTEPGRETLKSIGINKVSRQICLLGCLFYPADYSMASPNNANKDHIRGKWMTLDTVTQHLSSTSCYAIVDKPHWLAPLDSASQTLLTRDDLVETLRDCFADIPHPKLVAEFKNISPNQPGDNPKITGLSSCWHFIVPQKWPKR
ncbi:DUF1853 family protein [Aliikangiella marina]|uniref:DUF1853 family protein n=1 Tax=Aliikangiella marina TaxID=1712262 RepID=A0A545TD10_9GAMM|nr:DUF1853 family protein [Aliikangiella marina]TQV75066.1 DUF1853 family protein [Aliikangiella marina]